MDKIERDNLIVKMAALGVKPKVIADEIGIPLSRVKSALSSHQFCITPFDPPQGMSVKTAWRIYVTLGDWPSDKTMEKLAGRMEQFMQAPGTRLKDWDEYRMWLAGSGYL
ncbi:hypothetical protein [Neorhizobium sp. R1-B]|uniref:hypothetical protein n=1 Tax=Neorhizobium sp. R1-B TaxID=2485162 RepID=UPI001064F813|nr:hypothetical protein [Neorhizobium sp. R1-B]